MVRAWRQRGTATGETEVLGEVLKRYMAAGGGEIIEPIYLLLSGRPTGNLGQVPDLLQK